MVIRPRSHSYGIGDRASRARVGCRSPSQRPATNHFDQDVRYTRIVENAATQLCSGWASCQTAGTTRARRPVRSCQFAGCTKHLSRYGYTASTVVSARYVRALPRDERRECCSGRQPDKTRTKVRSILIEVPPEECRHKQRHYGHRPAKMRQFCLQPQVRLIVTISRGLPDLQSVLPSWHDWPVCSLYR